MGKRAAIRSEHTLTVTEAAKLMGVSPQYIRVGLQKGVLPIGHALKQKGKHYSYFISKYKFTEFTGIPT